MPHNHMHLSQPLLGPPIAHLSFCELVNFLIVVNSTMLHLSVEHDAVETYIRASRLCKGEILAVTLGNRAFISANSVTQAMGYGTVFEKVSFNSAALAPTKTPSGVLGLLFCGEG